MVICTTQMWGKSLFFSDLIAQPNPQKPQLCNIGSIYSRYTHKD